MQKHLLRLAATLCALTALVAGGATPLKPMPEQIQQMQALSDSLATQTAIYAAPAVAMYLLRQSVCFGEKPKAAPGEIWRQKDISTPTIAQESGYVSPNVNVVYGFGFLDLGREPVILTVPNSHDRYYMVEIVDMWTNAFAYAAGVATGYKGDTFALVGPGWQGELPAGVQRIDAPTRWIELQPRVHVKDEADLAAAEEVLNAITVKGLSEYTGKPGPSPVSYDYPVAKIDPKIASSMMVFDDPLQFWEIFSNVMNENPPPENEIKGVLPQLKYLGIELGKQWKREDVKPLVLEEMKKAAANVGAMSIGIMPLAGKLANGWGIPPGNVGMAGADYPTRAAVAVFGLTANTVKEAIYYSGLLDGNNEPLTGEKRYTITFKEPMDYLRSLPPSFWSVTMYDGVTRYSVPNPINRYSLGSDNDLKKDADGSFTLFLQADSPGPDKESNWLPAPKGPFYLILRNYAPVPEVVKGLRDPATFVGPPPVVPVP
jgi:hypothetical protein